MVRLQMRGLSVAGAVRLGIGAPDKQYMGNTARNLGKNLEARRREAENGAFDEHSSGPRLNERGEA